MFIFSNAHANTTHMDGFKHQTLYAHTHRPEKRICLGQLIISARNITIFVFQFHSFDYNDYYYYYFSISSFFLVFFVFYLMILLLLSLVFFFLQTTHTAVTFVQQLQCFQSLVFMAACATHTHLA